MLIDVKNQHQTIECGGKHRKPMSFRFVPFSRVNSLLKISQPLFVRIYYDRKSSMQFKGNTVFGITVVMGFRILFTPNE